MGIVGDKPGTEDIQCCCTNLCVSCKNCWLFSFDIALDHSIPMTYRVGTDSSAVESLLQLSNQLNGLLDDSADLERSVTNGSAGYGITLNGNILLVSS